jgi:uncharacterized protein
MRLTKYMGAAALALAALNMGGGQVMAQVQAPSSKNPTVAIGAAGTEEAAPDKASITAGLQTTEPTSEAAMQKNNRDFTKILNVIRKYGIPANELQTEGATVQQNFRYTDKGEEEDGYLANNSIKITMRDMEKLGNLIADLADAGANNISGPYFALEDTEPLMDKAREKAFDNAQRRALAYARKAGFKGVKLLTINEGAGNMDYAYGYAAEAAADAAAAGAAAMKAELYAAPIEPGLVSETVYASFLFEMVP